VVIFATAPVESERVRLCELNYAYTPTNALSRGNGIGSLALASLMNEQKLFGAESLPRHIQSDAKSVIVLFMGAGVSHVDTFDPNRLSPG